MELVRQYLMSLVAASIIVGIVTSVVRMKGGNNSVIRLVCGIFLALVMLRPVLKLEIRDYMRFYKDVSLDSSYAVDAGKNIARDEMHKIIKENLEAYILDKASALQLDVDVNVYLTEDLPPAPDSVTIQGAVSPYNKQVLQSFLAEEIGIPKEQQIWQ
ncbi:MAG: hypothetical protein IKJ94_04625 [Oscillospiraceae bacterium]|nr:hypothetical protein [Oscillospiraceae bacterium]